MGPVTEEPGITFYLKETKLTLLSGKTFSGIATIDAVVTDEDLWNEVVKRLEGMRLYRGDDIKTEIIEMLRSKANELEGKMSEEQDANNSKLEHLRQRNSILEGEHKHQKDRIEALENLLRAYKGQGV